MITEDNFIDELKNKNEEALDYIIDNYGNLIYKVAYMNLKSKELSEEIVNEVLIKVWRSIEKYSYPNCKFKNWVAAIAKNTAIDLIRKENKFKHNVEYDDSLKISNQSAEDSYLKRKEVEAIKKYINLFNDIDKEIFIERFFLCKTIKSIAEEKRMTPNAISLRILKGRKRMKELLEEGN